MSDFKSRLIEESDQLNNRIEKLKLFVSSIAFDSLAEIERTALKEQLQHMDKYADVLNKRVSRLCTGDN
jgi:hypothetical protein